jgi:hypothetical protein
MREITPIIRPKAGDLVSTSWALDKYGPTMARYTVVDEDACHFILTDGERTWRIPHRNVHVIKEF